MTIDMLNTYYSKFILWQLLSYYFKSEQMSMLDDVAIQMVMILGTMVAGIVGLVFLQTPSKKGGHFLPVEPSKRAYEMFVMAYTPVWILAFACIVAFGWYETFDKWSYIQVCLGLALPFLLQPIVLPSAGFGSPDANRPLLKRYSFKANVWLAMYSFIGNYWYTHCKEKLCLCVKLECLSRSDSNLILTISDLCNRLLFRPQSEIYHAITPLEQRSSRHVLCNTFLFLDLSFLLKCHVEKSCDQLSTRLYENLSLCFCHCLFFLLYRLYGNVNYLGISTLFIRRSQYSIYSWVGVLWYLFHC